MLFIIFFFFPFYFRYQKLQKGHTGDNDVAEHLATDSAAKYVILEEMDEQNEGI